MNLEPAFVSIPEGASFLRVGKSKVNELLAEGKLRRVKLGRRTLLDVQELRAFATSLTNIAA